MEVLVQFLLRLTFGMTICMAITSAKQVDSGFFRVHLWVALGLSSFATVLFFSGMGLPENRFNQTVSWALIFSTCCSTVSYLGSVIWIYEKQITGKIFIWLVSILALLTACLSLPAIDSSFNFAIEIVNFLSSGMLLGSTICAMLLGHWYLNNPGMKIKPLQLLVAIMLVSSILRVIFCFIGLLDVWESSSVTTLIFIALRWLWGLLGPIILALMTWQTLKIPNTQSATGILYVGVICVFLGELSSQLLSEKLLFPL